MHDYFAAMIERKDFSQFFTADVVWTTMESGEQIRGRGAVRDHIVDAQTRIFDAHPEVTTLVVDDGVAALEAVFVGRHIGEVAGLKPSGAEIRVPYTMFYRVTDEGIAELHSYLSPSVVLDQLHRATLQATGATTPTAI
ncbi:ester cyclase [Microbacteriaceae bacterium 4G12]